MEKSVTSVADLINQCNFAMGRMGNNNPHKILLFNLGSALSQLVDRLVQCEKERDACLSLLHTAAPPPPES